MEDLQRKIAARSGADEDDSIPWTKNNDILYSLLCIAFFADEEIDESEKDIIFDSYRTFVPKLSNEMFNSDFGLAYLCKANFFI